MITMDTICARVYSRDDEDEVDKKIVPGYSWEVGRGGGRGEGVRVHEGAGAINSSWGHTEDKVDKGETRDTSREWRLEKDVSDAWTAHKVDNEEIRKPDGEWET